jgi:deoxyribonuclease V
MILAIDVQYVESRGFVSAVAFDDWEAIQPDNHYETLLDNIAEYQPGQFYKRELPCILKLLEENNLHPDIIVIDGYVTLNEGKPGLGMHLYNALDKKTVIIGVAKRSFSGIDENTKLFRGTSNNPLFITSIGMPLGEAKKNISKMQGKNRIPVLLKLVDSLCRNFSKVG